MILKLSSNPDDVYIIESIPSGVTITSWSEFRYRASQDYSRIVVRNLDFERSPDNLKTIQLFVKETTGSKHSQREAKKPKTWSAMPTLFSKEVPKKKSTKKKSK